MLEPLIRPILKRCVENGIPIIGNFGAANPLGAARLIHAIARDEGIPSLKVGVIGGDDLRGSVAPEDMALWEADKPIDLARAEIIAATAHIGAFPHAGALARGAQGVVAGRGGDP